MDKKDKSKDGNLKPSHERKSLALIEVEDLLMKRTRRTEIQRRIAKRYGYKEGAVHQLINQVHNMWRIRSEDDGREKKRAEQIASTEALIEDLYARLGHVPVDAPLEDQKVAMYLVGNILRAEHFLSKLQGTTDIHIAVQHSLNIGNPNYAESVRKAMMSPEIQKLAQKLDVQLLDTEAKATETVDAEFKVKDET